METNSRQAVKEVADDPVRVASTDGSDERFQEEILAGVSRTFALTIPQLPESLRTVITNGYLLCRIADTIEDDSALTADEKDHYLEAFLAAVKQGRDVNGFASGLHLRLSPQTLADERILVREFPRVVRVTHRLPVADREALLRCVTTMGRGMGKYERNRSRSGLRDLEDTQRYCYFVAGVVGEMLTGVFCNYSGEIAAKREFLEDRAVDFGQGLQLTNILKDIWDDIERDTCWLPRELFDNHGYDLSGLEVNHNGGGANFASAMHEMVGITHAKLRRALAYTLEIPRHETGIRRFLIWAVLLAVMTLRNIYANPLFNSKDEVKVSRRTLKTTFAVSNAMIRSNVGLRSLFVRAARGLPCANDSRSSGGDTPRRPVAT